MKKQRINKLIYLLLAVLFLNFSSCGRNSVTDDSASSMSRVFSAATVAIPDGYGLADVLTYRDGAFYVDLLLSDGDSYFTDKGRKRMTFSTAGEILDIAAAESAGGNGDLANW